MEALITLAVPAIVKLLELINEKKWAKVGLIALAAVSGAGLGFATGGTDGILDGVLYGLSGSGLVTVAGYAGEKAAKAK